MINVSWEDAKNFCRWLRHKTGEYYNIEVLDIRWHTLSKPTRKGIRLNMEEAKKLLNVLKRVLDE